MKIMIELLAGSNKRDPKPADMDKNIEALRRAVDGKPQARDFILLMDTISILEGIKEQLRLEHNAKLTCPKGLKEGI